MYTLTYSNNIDIGIATIKVSGKGNYGYNEYYHSDTNNTFSKTVTFEIRENIIPISDADISIQESYEFTGDEVVPEVVLTYEGNKLVKDEDYTLECVNNVNVGTATIIIKGIGAYLGSFTKEFSITAKELSSENVTISKDVYKYTGDEIEPTFTVTDGTHELVSGTDYTFEYSNNIDAGIGKTPISAVSGFDSFGLRAVS